MKYFVLTLLLICSLSIAAQQQQGVSKIKPAAAKPAREPEVADMTSPKKASTPGPFGFEAGMTKEQVISKLGSKSIGRTDDQFNIVSFNTAPVPHPILKTTLSGFLITGGSFRLLLSRARLLLMTAESRSEISSPKYPEPFTLNMATLA